MQFFMSGISVQPVEGLPVKSGIADNISAAVGILARFPEAEAEIMEQIGRVIKKAFKLDKPY